jgi:hypothetical protein
MLVSLFYLYLFSQMIIYSHCFNYAMWILQFIFAGSLPWYIISVWSILYIKADYRSLYNQSVQKKKQVGSVIGFLFLFCYRIQKILWWYFVSPSLNNSLDVKVLLLMVSQSWLVLWVSNGFLPCAWLCISTGFTILFLFQNPWTSVEEQE